MSKLFKYLKPHAAKILLILLVLVIQAYSDLSLPGYTSDIVNVGIQQGGIDATVPEQIAGTDMDKLILFVHQDDQEKVLEAYELNDSEYDQEAYILKPGVSEDDDKMDELTDIMGMPMMMVSGFESGSDITDQMKEALFANMPAGTVNEDTSIFEVIQMIPAEQWEAMLDQIEDQLTDMPESITSQAATAYVKTAYENLGIDTDKIQINYILSTGVKMIGFAFLGMAASVLVGLMAARIGAQVGHELRRKVFKKVVGFSNSEFDTFSTASLITRSTNDIQQIQVLTAMMLRMVLYSPILALGGVYRVFQTNASMSWIIALAVAAILLVVILLFSIVMPKFRILQSMVDRLNLVTREILSGLPVIRAFSRERHEEERFDKANVDLTKTNLFVNRAMTFMMPVMTVIMNGVTVMIVWVGANGINDGQMQVGDMMAFITYAMQIIMSFLMICMISIMLPRAAVSAARVDEVLVSETLIHDPEKPEQLPEKISGTVKFDHVSFRYPNAEEDVLSDINFTALPGQTTAIIGSTGSGKSTLINLIPRFFDVTGGKVTIDDVDIRNITQHNLRDQLGYVPQKGILFSGTIESNIKYGNTGVSDEEMRRVAGVAQAADFIEAKSDKYESHISQGGSNVSGGQRQRLSIARAIAKEPKIFIFDDSFSALDYKTDTTLRKALKEHTSDSTVIIVAQRISTILHAEQIIVLDEGNVAGIGTHKELLKSCDAYYQIAQSQLSEAELKKDMGEDEEKGGNSHE